MIEREKVIKELHDARRYLEDKEWSDRGASPHIDAINDALDLLKEREPKPITITTNLYGTKFYHCPNCNKTFYEPWELYKDYCYNCGQAVKWDEHIDVNQTGMV